MATNFSSFNKLLLINPFLPGLYMQNDKNLKTNFNLKWGVEGNCHIVIKTKEIQNLMPFLTKVYGDLDQNQKISLLIMKDKMLCQIISANAELQELWSKVLLLIIHFSSGTTKIVCPLGFTCNRWQLANQIRHSPSLTLAIVVLGSKWLLSKISRASRTLRGPQPLL